jgi:hypothetical protein
MSVIVKHHPKVYFTFGRFQPPTIGHRILIDTMSKIAREENADAYVFVSSKQNNMEQYRKSKAYKEMKTTNTFWSTDLNENPLSVGQKVEFLRLMYPDTPTVFVDTTLEGCTQLFHIIDALRSVGYTDITMAIGSDRLPTFQRVLRDSSIKVISLGERTVNSENMSVKAMSGTKMRLAAIKPDLDTFMRGTMIGNMTEEDVMRLMNMIRVSLDYTPYTRGGSKRKNSRRNQCVNIKTRRRGTYKLREYEKFDCKHM